MKDSKDRLARDLGDLTVTLAVNGELVRQAGLDKLLGHAVESCARDLAGRLFQEINSKLDLVEIAQEVRKKIIADHTERFLTGLEAQEELRKMRIRLILLEAFAGPMEDIIED